MNTIFTAGELLHKFEKNHFQITSIEIKIFFLNAEITFNMYN